MGAENNEKDKNENGQGAENQNGAGAGTGNSGADNGANNNTGEAGKSGADSGNENKGSEKTFTQTEVTKMMAKEKHQGANSVYNELGIKPGDKKQIDAIKEYLASQKTDEQKALEAEHAKAQEIADAEQRAVMAEAKAEAMMIGVQTQFVEDAVTLALAKVAADEGTDIKTALGELKTKYPVWFGSSEDDKDDKNKNVGQKGTGSSVKASEKDKSNSGASLGSRLAAKKKGTGKATYWGANK